MEINNGEKSEVPDTLVLIYLIQQFIPKVVLARVIKGHSHHGEGTHLNNDDGFSLLRNFHVFCVCVMRHKWRLIL